MSVPRVSRRWRWRARTLSGAYFVKPLYIVTSALGIYMLNPLIGFLSPQVDGELQELAEGGGPSLATRGSDEFRPFVHRLPELKFTRYDRKRASSTESVSFPRD